MAGSAEETEAAVIDSPRAEPATPSSEGGSPAVESVEPDPVVEAAPPVGIAGVASDEQRAVVEPAPAPVVEERVDAESDAGDDLFADVGRDDSDRQTAEPANPSKSHPEPVTESPVNEAPSTGAVESAESVSAEPDALPDGPEPEPSGPETTASEPAITEPDVDPEPEVDGDSEPFADSDELVPLPSPGRHEPGEVADAVLRISALSKHFGDKVAVDSIDLAVPTGSLYGIVGPNGAGKTTTLSMVTGLLRPDSGQVVVHDVDVWADPQRAKRSIGVLPDSLRLFDRLTGSQLLYYSGVLRGLDRETVVARSADLATAFGIEDAMGRLVTDYSAGMTKKIALAAAMIHSPRILVLDEPFESVDPVSAANLVEILQRYVAGGGTVVLSSHGMDFIQRVCDHVAVIVGGRVLASGTMDEVREGRTLEERFVELAGGRKAAEGMEWLHSFSD